MAEPFVRIRYQLVGADGWHERSVSAEEYFEPGVDAQPEQDRVPLFAHACDYLDLAPERIAQTVLELYGDGDGDGDGGEGGGEGGGAGRAGGGGMPRRTVTEVLWNGGANRLIESAVDGRPDLLVVQLRTADNPPTVHTVRYDKSGGQPGFLSHSVDIEGPVGRYESVHSTWPP